jgi:hypothetical protein
MVSNIKLTSSHPWGQSMPPQFASTEIAKFLCRHGYACNPAGLILFDAPDYVQESEESAYLDINADAVRKGDEVPDRPIRISFVRQRKRQPLKWKLKAVEELEPGIPSKALDRQMMVENSPWPTKPSGKKPYETPRLIVYGDLHTLTKGSGMTSVTFDSGIKLLMT